MERTPLKFLLWLLMLAAGCATASHVNREDAAVARGPWQEVPAVEMPTGETSIPISLLRDVAERLLKLPGAKVCDRATQRPIAGLSTEYCSTVYVAGGRDSLSWRVTEPRRGTHNSCEPFSTVKDEDPPASQVWVVGYIHNHPCAAPPSSLDLGAWPTDDFNPYVAMAEVRLIPGNPVPALYKTAHIEMASALVAERQDGTRVFLRYFPTGEIQQWSTSGSSWVTLAVCAPSPIGSHGRAPQCREPLRLLRE